MKVYMIGDVIALPGCEYVRRVLPEFKRRMGIDFVIANGENSAAGNGILPVSAEHLFDSGVDVITGGNHTFRRKEIYEYMEHHQNVIRPENYYSCQIGKGYHIYDLGRWQVAVVNLQGRVYMDNIDCPFQTIDRVLNEIDTKYIFVDFHAEATGEKKALAHYCDGRVTGFFGTHTHVQTNDADILPKGTGYITDVGMTGPINSVLGVYPNIIIDKLKYGLPIRFEISDEQCMLNGVLVEVDTATGRTKEIKIVNI